MRLLHNAIVAACLTFATGAFSPSANAEEISLKFAAMLPVEHYSTKVLEEVAEEVRNAGVGVNVTTYPAAQLGSGEELLEDTIRGNIDLVYAYIYANKDPVLEINALPFLTENWDDLLKVYGSKDSAYSQIMAEVLGRMGLVHLNQSTEGFVGLVATERPEDYASVGPKGLSIRIWNSQAAKDAVEAIGYRTTTMSFNEVFAAIQSGVVDGAMCCTAQLAYTQFNDSGKVRTYVAYNMFVDTFTFYASGKTWEKLTDEQKSVIQAAVDRAAEKLNAWGQQNDLEYVAKLKEAGWEVLELSDEERAAMVKHVRAEVWPKLEETVGSDVIARLRDGN